MDGIHFSPGLEDLDGEYRAGKTQCKSNQQGRARRDVRKKTQPEQSERQNQQGDQQADQQHVHARAQPDHGGGKILQVQLQPDGEQQQADAEVGDLLQQERILHTHRAEYEARREKADQGWQAGKPCKQPQHERDQQRNDMHDVDRCQVDRSQILHWVLFRDCQVPEMIARRPSGTQN